MENKKHNGKILSISDIHHNKSKDFIGWNLEIQDDSQIEKIFFPCLNPTEEDIAIIKQLEGKDVIYEDAESDQTFTKTSYKEHKHTIIWGCGRLGKTIESITESERQDYN